jgi:hypothetical protein
MLEDENPDIETSIEESITEDTVEEPNTEEIKILTKLEMYSRNFKANITSELLQALEKHKIFFTIN